ncbi:MAG: AAA family ATPase [Alphaproteobacteria bacterium]
MSDPNIIEKLGKEKCAAMLHRCVRFIASVNAAAGLNGSVRVYTYWDRGNHVLDFEPTENVDSILARLPDKANFIVLDQHCYVAAKCAHVKDTKKVQSIGSGLLVGDLRRSALYLDEKYSSVVRDSIQRAHGPLTAAGFLTYQDVTQLDFIVALNRAVVGDLGRHKVGPHKGCGVEEYKSPGVDQKAMERAIGAIREMAEAASNTEAVKVWLWPISRNSLSLPAFFKMVAAHKDEAVRVLDLDSVADQWETCGKSHAAFGKFRPPASAGAPPTEMKWLVRGLIPAGRLILWPGASGVGKTTALTEMAVGIASPQSKRGTFAGFPFEAFPDGGAVVHISGEDNHEDYWRRAHILDPNHYAGKLIGIPGDGRPLADIVADIRDVRDLALVIVDPSRKYIDGDEDSSRVVSEYLSLLESLSAQTGCAVICVHHLSKNAAPRSLQEVMATMRGSSVLKDRPRLIIPHLHLKDGDTVFGVGKSNLVAADLFEGPIRCRQNPDTLRLERVDVDMPAPRRKGRAAPTGTDGDRRALVLRAIRGLTDAGRPVARTGKYSLYKWHQSAPKDLPELDGMSREQMAEAFNALEIEGAIKVGGRGRIAFPDGPGGADFSARTVPADVPDVPEGLHRNGPEAENALRNEA